MDDLIGEESPVPAAADNYLGWWEEQRLLNAELADMGHMLAQQMNAAEQKDETIQQLQERINMMSTPPPSTPSGAPRQLSHHDRVMDILGGAYA